MVHSGVQRFNARYAVDVAAAVARRWPRNLFNVFRFGPNGRRIGAPLDAIFETHRVFETVQFGAHRRTVFLVGVLHGGDREVMVVVGHGTAISR
jgi:hypothetical protein